MNQVHYRLLVRKILEEFPNELEGIYYTAPVSKKISSTNKSIGKRGKLPDKIRNLLSTTHTIKKRKQQETLENQNKNKRLKDLQSSIIKLPLQLNIVGHPLPPRGRRSKKIKHSLKEALNNIFVIVQNPGDIEKTMKNQIDRAYAKNDTVQPYIIIQGSYEEQNQILLIRDDIKYQFTSAVKAFDCLFKLFHVLNVSYP
ncbi:hypothetical protein KQX54_012118 [Cotesia glomerata]|uniref:Uncharacterized protein n=1 Tax=Cotesia glomerata TaxID=32391 RepID=A0AAV7IJ31_COTGL|nr:hypothetical protein KQX54_012118 [Cotesia glomerata]